jgi:hypothetical protein
MPEAVDRWFANLFPDTWEWLNEPRFGHEIDDRPIANARAAQKAFGDPPKRHIVKKMSKGYNLGGITPQQAATILSTAASIWKLQSMNPYYKKTPRIPAPIGPPTRPRPPKFKTPNKLQRYTGTGQKFRRPSMPVRTKTRKRKRRRRGRRYSGRRFRRGVQRVIARNPPVTQWLKTRKQTGSVASCAKNQAGYDTFEVATKSLVTSLCDDEYRQLTSTGTQNIVDLTDAVATKTNVRLMYRVRYSLMMKNNYNFIVNVICYHLRVRKDSAQDPETVIDLGLSNLERSDDSGQLVKENPAFYPQDSHVFRQHYKIVKKRLYRILPGGLRVFNCKRGMRTWRPNNSSTLQEYTRGHTEFILLRIVGDLSHDPNVVGAAGYANANLDCMFRANYTYGFSGGIQMQKYATDNVYDDLTATTQHHKGGDKETNP